MMKRHTTLLLILCAIMQVGCTKAEKKETFKQGDLQTWKVSDGLIFKGYLGERRKHIPDEFDAQFYFPNSEKFIGQFPIDYTPKPFDKVSHEEAKQGFNDNLSGEPLEFYLMLNGSWVKPTDASIFSQKALDHEDQVKVQIKYLNKVTSPYNTKENFNERIKSETDIKSKHHIGNLTCFNSLDGSGRLCFMPSKKRDISGIIVADFLNDTISLSYSEFVYGGIDIVCILHKKHINQISQIDQAIWRLLDTWNIVPN